MSYITFAQWFGLVSVILALGILFNLEDAREMAKSMIHSDSGYIMGGVLPVIFGCLPLLYFQGFNQDWSLAVAFIGAAMVLIGIFRIVFVRQWKSLLSEHVGKIPFLFSLFGLMIGVILLYIGFVATAFDVPVTA